MAKRNVPPPIPPLQPRNPKQLAYYKSLKANALVFGIGPAGTGKTHIAAQYAAEQMVADDTHRLVIIRPTVTVDDEEIGFLPGSLNAKIGPFAAPVMEELAKVAGIMRLRNWMPRVEVLPVAFIRGRNLDNCTIHVSEAQNLSAKQCQAIVTRQGENSTLIIEGDPAQSDIDGFLLQLIMIAEKANIPHGKMIFSHNDVVRSDLVRRWVNAFIDYPGDSTLAAKS